MRIPFSTPRFLVVLSRVGVLAVVAVVGGMLVPAPDGAEPTVHTETIALTAPESRVAGGPAVAADPERAVEMAGFTWPDPTEATLEVRGRVGRVWLPWTRVEGELAHGPDGGTEESSTRSSAGPVWLGHDIDEIEIRVVEGQAAGLQLHAIDTEPGAPAAPPGIDPGGALVPQGPVITRAQWGADESWRTVNCDGQPDYASGVHRAVIHHTVNSNTYLPTDAPALLRGMYSFHVFSNGWCDLGYNFVVDRYGQVFEGRFGGIYRAVIGGHASGFNTGSTGVAVLGDFTAVPVPAAAYGALRQLLAWKLGFHGVEPQGQQVVVVGESTSALWPAGTPVLMQNVSGHLDGNATSCPGQFLYALLPQLRADVANSIAAYPDLKLVCDWDGDGDETPAWYENGYWYIRNDNSVGFASIIVHYGGPGYLPVCGDWNGDGVETIGVYFNGRWLLRDANTPGPPQHDFAYGAAGMTPVVGNWDGAGADGVGAYDGGRWYLRNQAGPGPAEAVFDFGVGGYKPLAGDWDTNHSDTIGIFVNGSFRLRNTNTAGLAQVAFDGYGFATDTPLAGDWNDDGKTSIGIVRGHAWWLRDNLVAGNANIVFTY